MVVRRFDEKDLFIFGFWVIFDLRARGDSSRDDACKRSSFLEGQRARENLDLEVEGFSSSAHHT